MKKKLLCLLTALCFIIPAVINLSACSHGNVKPGPLSSMIGTYKLTNYVTRHEDGIDVDMIKTKHAKAYIVVGDNGYGYYIYSDDDTALNCDTIKIDYTYDEETPGYVRGFSYTNGIKKLYEWEEHPGAGEEAPLHFVCGKKKKTLNYTMSEQKTILGQSYKDHYVSYYTSVDYEKVSDDTTLAYVQNQLNTTFSAMPNFKLKNLNHPMLVSFRESALNNNYKYCVLDMDILHSKATLHYQRTRRF